MGTDLIWIVIGLMGVSAVARGVAAALPLLREGARRWVLVEAQVLEVREGQQELGEGLNRRLVSIAVAECRYHLPDSPQGHTAAVELDPQMPRPDASSAVGSSPRPVAAGATIPLYVREDQADRPRLSPPPRGRALGSALWQSVLPVGIGGVLIWYAVRLRGGAP